MSQLRIRRNICAETLESYNDSALFSDFKPVTCLLTFIQFIPKMRLSVFISFFFFSFFFFTVNCQVAFNLKKKKDCI